MVSDADAPGFPLRRGGKWFDQFSADDYVMYKPDGDNTIWVPLSRIGPWKAAGTGVYASGCNWKFTPGIITPASPSGAKPKALPT